MRRRDFLKFQLVLGVSLPAMLAGCAKPGPEAPRAIKIGRDICEHCTMLISEPRYAAELWNPAIKRYHLFDDVGCAVVYAKENAISEGPEARIWVGDSDRSGEWLDAREAYFRTDGISPMGYNFAAMTNDAPGRIRLDELRRQAVDKALCAPPGAARERRG